ncbi:MAG: MBL fold metallo-hydrolase, partial [bacterium]|nr:MBL fold metallo-hydrolase [bacterium]
YHIAGYLFSGDTLFKEGVGRTWGDTEAEKRKKLEQQVSHIKAKLLSLPDDTPVFPGHGPSSNIGNEKSFNLYLKN